MSDQKKRKQSLLDDDDGGDKGATHFGIRVNKAYAARFEHNKQREELHRLQNKYPEEAEKLARKIARDAAKAAGKELPPRVDGDSSEDEEEDDGEIPVDTEAKIFETLLRIRHQDPSIYEKDVQFFGDDGDEQADDVEGPEGGKPGGAALKGTKKPKPMYLKDLIAKQALEYGPGGDSSDEDADRKGKDGGKKRHPKAYDMEQEKLRKAFLEAAVEAEEGEAAGGLGGVLKPRQKAAAAGDADCGDEGDSDEGAAVARKTRAKQSARKGAQKPAEPEGQFQQLIEAYFGSEAELHPDDKFLKEFIVNKGWVDRDDDYVPSYHEVVGDEEDGDGAAGVDDEEDDAYLQQMDAFEAKYNFRYEEPGADRIITHPRVVDGTVRKPDDRRKRQRDAKKQRLEEAEDAAREDVKRLKNLKKHEIESKMDKLRNVAGAAAPAAASLDDMLDGDFDPEEWDKKMAAAFDDTYYDAEEELENLQDDLDLLGGDMDESDDADDDGDGGGDDEDEGEGRPVRFRELQKKLKEVDALGGEPEGEKRSGKARSDPEVAARQRAELQRLLEDYYKLDYEDNVGGIKTRFRYKEVPANNFGLSVDEILRLNDKALNQVAGMKRLAPYREDVSKQRPNYKALEMVKGDMANLTQQKRPNKKRDWQKGSGQGRQGGQFWREKGEPGEAAGVGPGSSGAAAKPARPHQPRDEGDLGKPQAGNGEDNKEREERPKSDSGKAGPGPGSQVAAQGRERKMKRKRQEGDTGDDGRGAGADPKRPQRKEPHKQKLDPQQARLASYAVPTLKKEPSGGQAYDGKKRKSGGQQAGKPAGGAAEPTDGLSRAQRKNMKRSQKRAGKRDTEKS